MFPGVFLPLPSPYSPVIYLIFFFKSVYIFVVKYLKAFVTGKVTKINTMKTML